VNKFIFGLSGFVPALLLSVSIQAGDCEFEQTIDKNLDLAGSQSLSVIARAGKLSITGKPGLNEALITGRVCASSEEWLNQSSLILEAGTAAKIEVDLPDMDSGWTSLGNRYVYLDLELIVPDQQELEVVDSSGDMTIDGVGALSVTDSSGSMEISASHGPVQIKDSSGDIRLDDIEGDVTVVLDSSGGIEGRSINGSVLVMKDSSGNIRFEDVAGDFIVERDSSGEISAKRVGGDFKVLKDGSGGISFSQVTGEVSIPENH